MWQLSQQQHFPKLIPCSGNRDFTVIAKQAGTGLCRGEQRPGQWVIHLGPLSFSWPCGARAGVQPDGGLWEVARMGRWEELLWLRLARGHHPLEWQCQAGGAEPHQGQRWASPPPLPSPSPTMCTPSTHLSPFSLLRAGTLSLSARCRGTTLPRHFIFIYAIILHGIGIAIFTCQVGNLRLRVSSPGLQN